MALPITSNATDNTYNVAIDSLATAGYVPIARGGRVKDFSITNAVVTATASETFQLAIALPGSTTFTNIVTGIVTVASGAAAGSVSRVTLAPSADAWVQDGGCIRITPAGTQTGGVPLTATISVGV